MLFKIYLKIMFRYYIEKEINNKISKEILIGFDELIMN